MTEPNNNPFASPPLEHEDPADAPLLDGDKIGRWLALPLASGLLNGAALIVVMGVLGICMREIPGGEFWWRIQSQEGRSHLGLMMLYLAIYGGFLGSIAGILLGGIAFALRKRQSSLPIFYFAGYLLAILFLAAPIGIIIWLNGLTFNLQGLVIQALVTAAALLFGWRLTSNIRKYLLSRVAEESA